MIVVNYSLADCLRMVSGRVCHLYYVSSYYVSMHISCILFGNFSSVHITKHIYKQCRMGNSSSSLSNLVQWSIRLSCLIVLRNVAVDLALSLLPGRYVRQKISLCYSLLIWYKGWYFSAVWNMFNVLWTLFIIMFSIVFCLTCSHLIFQPGYIYHYAFAGRCKLSLDSHPR